MKHFGGPHHTAHSRVRNIYTRKNNNNNNNSTRKNHNNYLKEHFEDFVLRKVKSGQEGFWKGMNKNLNNNNVSIGAIQLLRKYKKILEDEDFIEAQREKLSKRKMYNIRWISPKDFDKVYNEELNRVNKYLERYDN